MPTHLGNGEGRRLTGRNEHEHHEDSRGKGAGMRERFAEITPGRAYFQSGLTATDEDCESERKQRDIEDPGLAHEFV